MLEVVLRAAKFGKISKCLVMFVLQICTIARVVEKTFKKKGASLA